mgnify:FL=1
MIKFVAYLSQYKPLMSWQIANFRYSQKQILVSSLFWDCNCIGCGGDSPDTAEHFYTESGIQDQRQ